MTVFIGWDVGAWNCERGASRDALFALSGNCRDRLRVIGPPGGGTCGPTSVRLVSRRCPHGSASTKATSPSWWPLTPRWGGRPPSRIWLGGRDGSTRYPLAPTTIRTCFDARTSTSSPGLSATLARPRHDREPSRQGSARTPPVRSLACEAGRVVRREVDGHRGPTQVRRGPAGASRRGSRASATKPGVARHARRTHATIWTTPCGVRSSPPGGRSRHRPSRTRPTTRRHVRKAGSGFPRIAGRRSGDVPRAVEIRRRLG